MTRKYYAVVFFGPAAGQSDEHLKTYYLSLERAVADAREVRAQSVRVVECPSRPAAISADISDEFLVRCHI